MRIYFVIIYDYVLLQNKYEVVTHRRVSLRIFLHVPPTSFPVIQKWIKWILVFFVLLNVQHSCLPQMFLNMYRWDQILKKIIHYVQFGSLKIIDIYIFKFYSNIFAHEKYFFSIDSILTCIMSNVSLWARSTGSPKTI